MYNYTEYKVIISLIKSRIYIFWRNETEVILKRKFSDFEISFIKEISKSKDVDSKFKELFSVKSNEVKWQNQEVYNNFKEGKEIISLKNYFYDERKRRVSYEYQSVMINDFHLQRLIEEEVKSKVQDILKGTKSSGDNVKVYSDLKSVLIYVKTPAFKFERMIGRPKGRTGSDYFLYDVPASVFSIESIEDLKADNFSLKIQQPEYYEGYDILGLENQETKEIQELSLEHIIEDINDANTELVKKVKSKAKSKTPDYFVVS